MSFRDISDDEQIHLSAIMANFNALLDGSKAFDLLTAADINVTNDLTVAGESFLTGNVSISDGDLTAEAGNVSIGGSNLVHKNHVTEWSDNVGNVSSSGGTHTSNWVVADSDQFCIEATVTGRLQGGTRIVSKKVAISAYITSNALQDNYQADMFGLGPEEADFTFTLSALGSSNTIVLTFTNNNATYTSNDTTIQYKFLTPVAKGVSL